MIGYHVTTPKKLARYLGTGAILPPVRFWRYKDSAIAWGRRTGRTIILQIETDEAYPMPDHKPSGHAWWTPQFIREWTRLAENE